MRVMAKANYVLSDEEVPDTEVFSLHGVPMKWRMAVSEANMSYLIRSFAGK